MLVRYILDEAPWHFLPPNAPVFVPPEAQWVKHPFTGENNLALVPNAGDVVSFVYDEVPHIATAVGRYEKLDDGTYMIWVTDDEAYGLSDLHPLVRQNITGYPKKLYLFPMMAMFHLRAKQRKARLEDTIEA